MSDSESDDGYSSEYSYSDASLQDLGDIGDEINEPLVPANILASIIQSAPILNPNGLTLTGERVKDIPSDRLWIKNDYYFDIDELHGIISNSLQNIHPYIKDTPLWSSREEFNAILDKMLSNNIICVSDIPLFTSYYYFDNVEPHIALYIMENTERFDLIGKTGLHLISDQDTKNNYITSYERLSVLLETIDGTPLHNLLNIYNRKENLLNILTQLENVCLHIVGNKLISIYLSYYLKSHYSQRPKLLSSFRRLFVDGDNTNTILYGCKYNVPFHSADGNIYSAAMFVFDYTDVCPISGFTHRYDISGKWHLDFNISNIERGLKPKIYKYIMEYDLSSMIDII